ncbi:hypothetical protein LFL96_06135 [Paraburkholderia sp. D15]|uniref:hypothetical protein n=1 Tax=Paraburkholderia sp. D15 TaxID=2880218 RepID=UPI002478B018|nr:hypothetical protein [Paraburkholderia sp. D15]WGS51079.1 hypothetical protein LFL96_06135 [Paraburkholderia sp. D15]WKF59062.1 hypothetical protein HUO10_003570 [Paraburkholderia busanensis]
MPPKAAGKSTLGSCGDLPLEAQLAEGGGAGRAAIVARLTEEMERLSAALANAPPDAHKEGMLLVECLRAARRVVERSASFVNARGKS